MGPEDDYRIGKDGDKSTPRYYTEENHETSQVPRPRPQFVQPRHTSDVEVAIILSLDSPHLAMLY
jgi:hypothetical protein